MKYILLAGAVLALLTAVSVFAANTDGGGQFINRNTTPPGFYEGNLQHNQWGPRAIFGFYTGDPMVTDQANHQSLTSRVWGPRAPNNGLG